MYTACAVRADTTFPKNYGTEVELAMMVFNASHGILRWSAFFALHFWRLRLKISRIGA